MAREFPRYGKHGAAQCFNCDSTNLSPAMKSGYPAGRGEWRKKCLRCGMSTWYDVIVLSIEDKLDELVKK